MNEMCEDERRLTRRKKEEARGEREEGRETKDDAAKELSKAIKY